MIVTPRRCRPPQRLPQQAPRLRVEAGGGLVEQQHLGVVHQGARDHHALLLPARERRAAWPAPCRPPAARRAAASARALALGGRQAEIAAVVGEHLAHRELAVEVARSAAPPRSAASPRAARSATSMPSTSDAARRGPHQRGDAAERRALAGAVRPEQAEELPRLDGEGDPAHRLDRWRLARAGIRLREVLDDEDAMAGASPYPMNGRGGRRAPPRGRPSPRRGSRARRRARGRAAAPSAAAPGRRACPPRSSRSRRARSSE